MANGYEFELSDGTILQLVPNSGVRDCSISHGDTMIVVDAEKSSFKTSTPNSVALTEVPTVARFEPKELVVGACVPPVKVDDNPHIMRTCMMCNGRSCCVTNACGNCGCGWICD